MAHKRIIDRYVFREMVPPFLLTLLVLATILLMTQMLKLADYVVNYHVGLGAVALFLVYNFPFFLTFVIPMAVMLAVLLTFLRMSADSEITALKAGGMSLFRLLWPVMAFSGCAALLTAFMIIFALPWGRVSEKALLLEVAKNSVEIGIKARTFNHQIPGVVLYVNELGVADKKLRHVFIEDRRNPGVTVTVTAKEGKLSSDPENMVWTLGLLDVSVNQVDMDEKTVQTGKYASYTLCFDLSELVKDPGAGRPKDEEEMGLYELYRHIQSPAKKDDLWNIARMAFHKKFSLPLACLFLGFSAIPLGLVSQRAKRSFGVAIGLGFFIFYYLLLAAGEVFGEAGKLPPVIGMWIPNLVTGAMGAVLFHSAANDRPLPGVTFVKGLFLRLSRWRRSS